ncbi:MAG: hypothetical protein JWN44_5462, partial [Myxococcales bacterium]|nr:hypothetical protein [Myxococcales bacterium]
MSSIRCSRPRLLARLLLAFFLVVACARPTTATAATPAAAGQAHLSRGLKLYRGGHYREAIAEFETGYAAAPNPVFLLNIAQAWRRLGQLERTRAYYEKFVERTSPRNPARAQALAAIEKLDEQLRQRAEADKAREAKSAPVEPAPAVAAAPTPPSAPTTVPATPPSATAPTTAPPADVSSTPAADSSPSQSARPRSRAVGWAGVGLIVAGAAALGGGAGLTVLAQQAHDRYVHPADGAVYDPALLERRDLDRNLAIAAFAVGGALVVTGGVLAALFLPRRPARASAVRA